MCVCCQTKPFGFSVASLTRRNFVASAAAMGGIYATVKVLEPVATYAQTAKADIIIENAKIVTLDAKTPRAQAIAIGGDKVIGIGMRRELEPMRGPSTKIIDAGGRTVVPGLNDAHTHFIRGGLTYSQEVRWDGVSSLALALRMLKDQAQRTPAPHWVQVVGGWTPNQFKEKRLPTLDEINAACGDVPCFVMHLYDRAFINKAGLRALGWNSRYARSDGWPHCTQRRGQSDRHADCDHKPDQPAGGVRQDSEAAAGRTGHIDPAHDA